MLPNPKVFIPAVIVFLLLVIGVILANASETVDMYKIARIESNDNPNAYNKGSGARGVCQITPIVLKDYAQQTGTVYLPREMFVERYNLEVADWYMNTRIPQMLEAYGITDTLEHRLVAYNFGIGNLASGKQWPNETVTYIAKYKAL